MVNSTSQAVYNAEGKRIPQGSHGHDIPFEIGEKLVRYYVHYFWVTNKFYTLRHHMEEEDVVQEILLKFIRLHHFEKYSPAVTSIKYHIMRGVQTSMIDLMIRRRHDTISIDSVEGEDDQPIIEKLASPDPSIIDMLEHQYEQSEGYRVYLADLIQILPEKKWGPVKESPIVGECQLGVRSVFIHLAYGWSVEQVADLFGVSTGRMYQLQKSVREWVTTAKFLMEA